MPITLAHFGPAILLYAVSKKRISFLAFCATNILIDCEPVYYLLTGQGAQHNFFHTLYGATIVILCILFLHLKLKTIKRFPNLWKWKNIGFSPLLYGCVWGGYSHVLFDSLMHPDVFLFTPWSYTQPLLFYPAFSKEHQLIIMLLHQFCLLSGSLGMWIYMRTVKSTV